MELPLILSGPILRRVEPSLVSVWVALSAACTIKLSLWENQIKAADAKDSNLWFRGPDAGTKTVRVGDKLHIVVVTLKLPSGKILVPERLYSYDLELTVENQSAKQTLKSLGLLKNDPDNVDPDGDRANHLALGYEVDLLPCVLLPPKELTDLKIVHGSCRNPDSDFADGLAWLDDLLSQDKAYTSAIKRPHQLFLTGDQIYADEVPRPLLFMIDAFNKTAFGAVKEQLPLVDRTDSAQTIPAQTIPIEANVLNFPAGYRHNLIVNEAGMTTTAGASHVMSFGEFCALYLLMWSNVCWLGFPTADVPTFEQCQKSAEGLDALQPAALKTAIATQSNGELAEFDDYTQADYDRDIARLTEMHRTLPKVRRALANVPTYMIFDDHEITDDWFLNPTWRDRVLGSPLGSAIVRNGMLAYALFQGWGNDPVKFAPVAGATQKQPHEQLLDQIVQFMPAGAASGPNPEAASAIEKLLGLDLRNAIAADGSYAETNPPLKWYYTVPGEKHHVLVLDCRTQRSFSSRISPPGNIGLTAQAEQIPAQPKPEHKPVWFVVSSLPLLGPPIFDELFAPLSFRVFDFAERDALQRNRGTQRMPGTNPDAVEAWVFEPKLFEALLKRLIPYSPVIVLSGDVHYSTTNAMSYWSDQPTPARIVQFIASGLKNVIQADVVFASRSFGFTQKMLRSKIGAERLGWTSHSPTPVTVPPGTNISPRLRALLNKSPVLIPTLGWHQSHLNKAPDWAWRVEPIRDIRTDQNRPKMAQPATLFPEDISKKDNDISTPDLDGYHRVAERHARQLKKLNHSRQILFASSLAVISFVTKKEKDKQQQDIDMIYAIQDLYTAYRDPEALTERPKPLLYTRHEVPLRDVIQDKPTLNSPTQNA